MTLLSALLLAAWAGAAAGEDWPRLDCNDFVDADSVGELFKDKKPGTKDPRCSYAGNPETDSYDAFDDLKTVAGVDPIKITFVRRPSEHKDLCDTDLSVISWLDGSHPPLIVVCAGLFNRIRTKDQLACALGHEFAHAKLRHNEIKAELKDTAKDTWLDKHAEDYILGRRKVDDLEADMKKAVCSSLNRTSQKLELAADAVGQRLAEKAGYPPAACGDMARQMADLSWVANASELRTTHPSDAERIRRLTLRRPKP